MILIYLGCAWISGIFLGSLIDIPFPATGIGIVPLVLLLFFRKYRKPMVLLSFCLITVLSGAFYYRSSLPSVDENNLLFYNDSGIIEIKGMVTRYPEQKTTSICLYLQADAIRINNAWQKISGTALVFVPIYSKYDYGDVLCLRGEPQTPPKLDDFDYESYLATKGIYSTFWNPEIEVIDIGKGNVFISRIFAFRDNISDTIGRLIPEPQASLTRGILLGIKSGIPESIKNDFSLTGTAHILAISGLHLSIIAGIFITFGIRLFGRRGYIYIWLALAVIWIYVIFSGMNPPVIRAAIMVTLYLAAELSGRQRNSISALILAAAVMTGFTPRLLWDASFQMSFAAMAGLIFIFPLLQSLCWKLIPEKLRADDKLISPFISIIDSLSVSTGAILAVWPLIAFYFGVISPAGAIATLCTLPALPFVIFSGMACGIVGMLSLPIGQITGWITWLFASFILFVVEVFSLVPVIKVPEIGLIPIILYYCCIGVIIRNIGRWLKVRDTEAPEYKHFSPMKGNLLIAALFTSAVLAVASVYSIPDHNLHVCFLDVGQGDAILIQKENRQILIDGGPTPEAVMVGLGTKMPFWDRTIDLVILTHPDADHITGLLEVIERYKVQLVVYPDTGLNSPLMVHLLETLKEKNISNSILDAECQINSGDDFIMDILNPVSEKSSTDIDNDSIVIEMEAGDISFLFTGDIREETELRLLSSRAVSRCTVLKVAHHGSSTSTTEAFLNVTRPDIAIISCGKDNRFGHPSPKVLDRLADSDTTIYRTDSSGTIELITDGTTLRVMTDK